MKGAVNTLEKWLALIGLPHIYGKLDDLGCVTASPWDEGIKDMEGEDIDELQLSEENATTFRRALSLHKEGKTDEFAAANAATAAAAAVAAAAGGGGGGGAAAAAAAAALGGVLGGCRLFCASASAATL